MPYTLGQTTTPTPTTQTEVIVTPQTTSYSSVSSTEKQIWAVASAASAAAGAFHGYRRNQSIAWALVWAVLGGMFPVVVPAIALAQGFGKPRAGLAPA